jgi:hypothetical protein
MFLLLNIFVFVRSTELVAYISGMPSSSEIIKAMDEVSNTVGSKSVQVDHGSVFVTEILYTFPIVNSNFDNIYS